MSIPGAGSPLFLSAAAAEAAAPYQINRSLRFNDDDSAYLNRTPSSAGNRKTWTWSGWVKRSSTGGRDVLFSSNGGNAAAFDLGFDGSHQLECALGIGPNLVTSAVFRDFSAWMHIVVAVDTTQSTASNRIRIYVNGSEIDSFSAANYPAQNHEYDINNTTAHEIGRQSSHYFDGYLAEIHHVDGSQLAPTDFGEYDSNSVWQPKEFTGSYKSFDNSQTWSNNITTTGNNNTFHSSFPATNAFNNNDANYAHGNGDGSQSAVVTLSLSPGVSCSNTVSFLGGMTGSGTATISVNGGTAVNLTSGSSATTKTDVSFSGTVTSIVITKTSSDASGMLIYGFEIDGKRLVDNGVSISSNSFYLKFADNSSNAALGTDSSGNSNTWTVNNLVAVVDEISASSSEISNPNNSVSNHLNLFDGDTSTTVSSANGGTVVWTPSSNISISKIEGYFDDSLNSYRITMSVSGGSSQTITIDTSSGGTANQWNEFGDLAGDTIGPSNAITFSMLRPAGNDTNPGLHDLNALRINDKLVVLNSSQAGVDSLIDTPTNYTADSGNNGGNYCTLNPLTKTVATLSNGNLFYDSHSSTMHCVGSTFAVASGKYYWEYTIESSGTYHYAGIADVATDYTENWCGSNSGWSVSVNTGGNISYNNAENLGFIGTQPSSGQTWGWALDMDAGTLKVYINGSIQYSGNSIIPTSTSLTGRTVTPAAGHSNHKDLTFNFGQRPFAYTPPTGHVSLCTQNLPDPTIADGSTAMGIVTYSGDGTNGRAITGINHSPDLVWIKARNQTDGHNLFDIVRGTTKVIKSNNTNAELTESNSLTAFNSDGFTVGNNSSNAQVNQSSFTYVGWTWDGGTSTVSNTDGSITTNVRASASKGFSIIGYTGNATTGATIGHGLNSAPEWLVFKNRDDTLNWYVYHKAAGHTKYFTLDRTHGATTNDFLNNTAPTDSVITLKNTAEVNATGQDIICYAWTSVSGYSSFGSYTGNGASEGPFVFLGFRPRFLLYKRSDAADTVGWILTDSERNTYNVIDDYLSPTTASAEGTTDIVDFLSNGFKMRIAGADGNVSGGTYVYAAFAEHPFATARAR